MGNKSTSRTPANIVNLLKTSVAEKGQSAVARETGLTLLTVQNYLKGIGEPRQINLERLSKYFGMPIWALRGDQPPVEVSEKLYKLAQPYVERYKKITGATDIEEEFSMEVKYSDGDITSILINGIDVSKTD